MFAAYKYKLFPKNFQSLFSLPFCFGHENTSQPSSVLSCIMKIHLPNAQTLSRQGTEQPTLVTPTLCGAIRSPQLLSNLNSCDSVKSGQECTQSP